MEIANKWNTERILGNKKPRRSGVIGNNTLAYAAWRILQILFVASSPFPLQSAMTKSLFKAFDWVFFEILQNRRKIYKFYFL